MHFQLPDQLKNGLLPYDATLKVLAKEAAKTKRKKQTHPRGNVLSLGLIPEDIVSLSNQQTAIDDINSRSLNCSYFRFERPNESAVGGIESFAVIYYHKNVWFSFWFPRNLKDYWYGMSIAFKNTPTVLSKVDSNCFWRNDSSPYAPLYKKEDFNETTIGRTKWLHKTAFFTQDLINDGYTKNYWKEPGGNIWIKSYGKHFQIANAIKKVSDELMNKVPSWSHDRSSLGNLWMRTTPKGNSIGHCLKSQDLSKMLHFQNYDDEILDDYKNTADFWFDCMPKNNNSETCVAPPAIDALIKTPWFRKKLNWMCNTMELNFNKASNNEVTYTITAPAGEVNAFLESCFKVTKIYPDLNVDFLISRYDLLVETTFSLSDYGANMLWIREHLSPESFFNMLNKFHEEELAEYSEKSIGHPLSYGAKRLETNHYRFYWRIFEDTFYMLRQILEYNKKLSDDKVKLDPMPRRWRMNEWHDHLMSELWKVNNPNVSLPQKLFPNPIKVDNYTFIQPIDTHQLSKWGKAVRNCVGSASYAEGIKKFKYLIVLVMISGKPRYTIQLDVNNGVMNVTQIADVANKRLDILDRELIAGIFSKALEIREQQLTE